MPRRKSEKEYLSETRNQVPQKQKLGDLPLSKLDDMIGAHCIAFELAPSVFAPIRV